MSSEFNRKLLKRPDIFLARLREIYQWAENNLEKVIAIGAVVFVILGGWAAIDYTQDKKEEKLLSSFYGIEKKIDQKRSKNIKPLKELESELGEINQIIQKNPKSKAAFFSYLKLGDIHAEQKDYSSAFLFYEKALGLTSNHFYKLLVLYNLGYTAELGGDCTKAIEWFSKITSFKKQRIGLWTTGYRPNVFWISSAHFGIGRCYEKLNQIEQAKDFYLKVSDEFPNTVYADRARAYAFMLP